jgi:c(7)-type cytochrome triheme protein
MRNVIHFIVVLAVLGSAVSASALGGGDITFDLQKADPVRFSHDYHLKVRGLKCAACHFSKFSEGAGYKMKREAITKQDFCEHCHNGMKSFDVSSTKNCIRCHRKP